MFDNLTWYAILQAWPWFAAAAVVFIIAVGLHIALKPKRQPETVAHAADRTEWTLTGRIDFADCHQSERMCSKWRRPGFPLAQVASNTAHFVGDGQRYLK
jgi:hypothetical protein